MDEEDREDLARQGMGNVLPSAQCSACGYAARTTPEQMCLMEARTPCPHCGAHSTAVIRRMAYLEVCDWIAQLAISHSPRDHTAAVLMFCALADSMAHELVDSKRASASVTGHTTSGRKPTFKGLFGHTFDALLQEVPGVGPAFVHRKRQLFAQRGNFMHGESSAYHIHQGDAHLAMDLLLPLNSAYVWINNTHCLIEQRGGEGQAV